MLWSLGRLEIAQDHLPAEVEFNAKMLIVACKGRHSQVCFLCFAVVDLLSLLGVCRSLSGSNGSDIERIRKLAQLVQRLLIAYSITTVGRLDPDPQDGVSWACSPQ